MPIAAIIFSAQLLKNHPHWALQDLHNKQRVAWLPWSSASSQHHFLRPHKTNCRSCQKWTMSLENLKSSVLAFFQYGSKLSEISSIRPSSSKQQKPFRTSRSHKNVLTLCSLSPLRGLCVIFVMPPKKNLKRIENAAVLGPTLSLCSDLQLGSIGPFLFDEAQTLPFWGSLLNAGNAPNISNSHVSSTCCLFTSLLDTCTVPWSVSAGRKPKVQKQRVESSQSRYNYNGSWWAPLAARRPIPMQSTVSGRYPLRPERTSRGARKEGGSKRTSSDITYNLNLNSCGLIFFAIQIQNPCSRKNPTKYLPQIYIILANGHGLSSMQVFLISILHLYFSPNNNLLTSATIINYYKADGH